MQIQKHQIYQIDVPFDTIATETEIIFSRYITLKCVHINEINFIEINIEELYEHKFNDNQDKLIRIKPCIILQEKELPGTLHILLNGLCKNDITGNSEIIFALTLFSEIIKKLFTENKIDFFIDNFPKWNINSFVNEMNTPGNLSKISKLANGIKMK